MYNPFLTSRQAFFPLPAMNKLFALDDAPEELDESEKNDGFVRLIFYTEHLHVGRSA